MTLEDCCALVVDDDPVARELVKQFLHQMRCQTLLEADNGEAALPILSSRSFDLLFFDWEMDPINGLQLTRLVRRAEGTPNQQSPILIMTGHTQLENVIAASEAGATAVMAKPIPLRIFREKVEFALMD